MRQPSVVIDGIRVRDPEHGLLFLGVALPDANMVIKGSVLHDTIVGERARITGAELANSLIGDEAVVTDMKGEMTVSDHSEVRGHKH